MKQLVLIGNGFDLAHGYKTGYTDFLKWYLNNIVSHLKKHANYKDAILSIQLNEYVSRFLETNFELENENDLLRSLSERNFNYKTPVFWTKLLKSYSSNNDTNWIDIEAEFYKSLLVQLKKMEDGKHSQAGVVYEVKELNRVMDFIKLKLQEYLKSIDFNDGLKLSDVNEHVDEILEQSNLLKSAMIPSNMDVMFVNFNYTNTIERYIPNLSISDNVKVNYIHGHIDCETNPLIFGYGDEMDSTYEKIEQLNINEFTNSFKSFGYFKVSNYRDLLNFIGDSKFTVSIFGHSCGLSDRVLLNAVFEHKNCEEIVIYYYEKSKTQNDFFSKTQEISRHFRPLNKEIMRKRIKPMVDCKPLVRFVPKD